MQIKHAKEIGVALLFITSAVLLYFGMNYLKGINIFKHTKTYVATFADAGGLVEQGNVYIKGYKVGMVDKITYDFTKPEPFTVVFSTNPDIDLPEGTIVAMMADGLLGGEALDLRFPEQPTTAVLADGDTLESMIEAGLIDGIVGGLMANINPLLCDLDSVVMVLKSTLTEEQMQALVGNLNSTLGNAKGITRKLDNMMADRIPSLLDSMQLVVDDVHAITDNLAEADLRATILKLDTAVDGVNQFVDKVNSTDGTIGMLLNDKELYIGLNNTVTSADSLLTDLKAHPKRYVHFSLFGKKDK